MHINILSLFEEYFMGPFQVSIMKKAIEKKLIEISHTDIRSFSKDKHQKVDDRPFGGGPGMVLSPQPTIDALRSVKKEGSYVVYLSAQGNLLTAKKCQKLSTKSHLVLLCGHYEGIDERVIQSEVDEEISIGDYVLTNGCAAAIVLIDATMRFLPGVLGHPKAAETDSFSTGIFEGPQYTRPEVYEDKSVPAVLLKGHHKEIEKWRYKQGLMRTRRMRPDLYQKHLLQKSMLMDQQQVNFLKEGESIK